MVVYNNMAAMSALNETNRNTRKLSKASEKAASALKLNSACDDASAYAISEKMRVQVRALDQDIENTKTGRNLLAIAEGGIQNIVENLRYLKEKAINAANDHNTDEDRAMIQKEVNQRLEEINDIASSTSYNGRVLLNGDYARPIVKEAQAIVSVGSGAKATQNTVLDILAGFSLAAGLTTSDSPGPLPGGSTMRYGMIKGDIAYVDKHGNSGDTVLKVDFSKAAKADGSALVYPDDFDGQGFSMGCADCNAYSSIVFDASIPAGASTVYTFFKGAPVTSSTLLSSAEFDDISYEYVVGIKGVTDKDGLIQAFYNGMYAANAKENSMPMSQDITVNDPVNGDVYLGMKSVLFAGGGGNAHQLRLSKVGGELYLTRDTPNTWVLYGEGAITQRPEVINGVQSVEQKLSLVVHTGTMASENLHIFINDMRTKALGIDGLEVNPREKAERAIDIIDGAIEYALYEATTMGAYQSRLAETEFTLVAGSENTSSAESVIRDADMAKTMMEYAKYNVLKQASQSMLSQANQNPQNLLELLQ